MVNLLNEFILLLSFSLNQKSNFFSYPPFSFPAKKKTKGTLVSGTSHFLPIIFISHSPMWYISIVVLSPFKKTNKHFLFFYFHISSFFLSTITLVHSLLHRFICLALFGNFCIPFLIFHSSVLKYEILILQCFPHIKINSKLAGSHPFFIIFGNKKYSF